MQLTISVEKRAKEPHIANSMGTEKAFDKSQNPLMIKKKTLSKLRLEEIPQTDKEHL